MKQKAPSNKDAWWSVPCHHYIKCVYLGGGKGKRFEGNRLAEEKKYSSKDRFSLFHVAELTNVKQTNPPFDEKSCLPSIIHSRRQVVLEQS